jgi:uncharacterized membrane protein YvbJ
MALIKCKECGREISDAADSCPHCGFPLKQESNNNENITKKQMEEIVKDSEKRAYKDKTKKSISSCIVWIVIFFIILVIIGYCSLNLSGL